MGIFDAVRNHPAFSSAIGGAAVGAGAVAIAGSVARRRKKTKKTTRRKVGRPKSKKTTKKRSTSAFKKRRAKAFRGASSKKIKFTKNGQPYILLKSGKARFIKKSSARLRKKRKGGFS